MYQDAEEGSTEPTPSESDKPADDKTESTDDKTAEEPPSEQTEEQKTEVNIINNILSKLPIKYLCIHNFWTISGG